ncbi:GntR family transcriptional regulator [Andreprevotia lacus DSM 23236]|jgi:GntR family transcriptional regulator|uniref:GntR family transcriptional regulator n=1 Tax=Andreprevotia lacus DSM 23236 TaxID=1121001 RepID=A0A1W1XNJ3_9NEIS|nr:GntR family transcriptional regulator [Andreprevotia lacus]SMC25533.1 GntR family transcriptional regulator [Andreprevotia lacus DSM 23236]
MAKLTQQPLYKQVVREVLARIEAAEWHGDESLPSETDLGRSLGVSQGTVRKALDVLVADGVLYRRQGVGTFVADTSDFLARSCFTPLTGVGGEVPKFELLGCVRINAGEQLAEVLGLRRGAALWQVRKLLRVAGHIVGLEELLLPESSFPDLDMRRIRELKGNVPELCWRDFGVRLKDGEVRYRAVSAAQAEARLLQMEVGDPLLQIVRLSRDFDGKPQIWSVAWLRTEQDAFEPPQSMRGEQE